MCRKEYDPCYRQNGTFQTIRKNGVTWKQANEKLAREQVYSISTASTEGKPHAAPVWGIWKNNRFFFETDPKSPKGRNLIRNPRIVFHVQDGMDTVIVEGIAEREEKLRTLRVLKTDYVRKYDYKPDWSDKERQIVFRVKPRNRPRVEGTAHAQKSCKFCLLRRYRS